MFAKFAHGFPCFSYTSARSIPGVVMIAHRSKQFDTSEDRCVTTVLLLHCPVQYVRHPGIGCSSVRTWQILLKGTVPEGAANKLVIYRNFQKSCKQAEEFVPPHFLDAATMRPPDTETIIATVLCFELARQHTTYGAMRGPSPFAACLQLLQSNVYRLTFSYVLIFPLSPCLYVSCTVVLQISGIRTQALLPLPPHYSYGGYPTCTRERKTKKTRTHSYCYFVCRIAMPESNLKDTSNMGQRGQTVRTRPQQYSIEVRTLCAIQSGAPSS